jgi:hypothetical protein
MNTVQNPRMQAEALKRMGRGPDTQLIHMTDSEIQALNGLSGLVFNEPLRTNPETGLPEAGLFKKLLPTVLAIGATAFLGPGVGSAVGSAALGTGLTAFGGHLAGQALSGQDLDFGRAALAGIGSGVMTGLTGPQEGFFGAPVGGGGGVGAGVGTTGGGIPEASVALSPADTLGAGSDLAAFSNPFPQVPNTAVDIPAASALDDTFISSVNYTPPSVTGSTPSTSFFDKGIDYLTEDPLKRVVAPLGIAALGGEFDDPVAAVGPQGDTREPFNPKNLRAERTRRNLDLDEDGEITQEDILQVVQGLPEGQSSRFFTPTVFTEIDEAEEIKTGGLVGLQTGGEIAEAVAALTGGEGTSILPMIAQAVTKPEEEEQSVTAGHPLGTLGTLGAMPTSGISMGGGQPPQPFEGGGQPYFEGRVMGPGDGMTDNIPFVIAGMQEGGQLGMQPAVLSPDEYVIPADVVSMLGNGSSSAGANELDAFIGNFRMDKYGRPNQPPEMRGGLESLV